MDKEYIRKVISKSKEHTMQKVSEFLTAMQNKRAGRKNDYSSEQMLMFAEGVINDLARSIEVYLNVDT